MEAALLIFTLVYARPQPLVFPQGIIPVEQPVGESETTTSSSSYYYTPQQFTAQDNQFVRDAATELDQLKADYNCPSYTACLNVKYGTPPTDYPEPAQ